MYGKLLPKDIQLAKNDDIITLHNKVHCVRA